MAETLRAWETHLVIREVLTMFKMRELIDDRQSVGMGSKIHVFEFIVIIYECNQWLL